MDVDSYQLYKNDYAFVLWNWVWVDELSSDEDSDDDVESHKQDEEFSPDDEPSEPDDSLPEITHSVIFKCMGTTKESRYQELLELAKKKMAKGICVPVKIQKEPTNPVDARAIAFMCCADEQYERIGYVVTEVLNDVHSAMDENKILNVRFDWIRLLFRFRKPGWYAGIIITRRGEWSQTVMRSRSTD